MERVIQPGGIVHYPDPSLGDVVKEMCRVTWEAHGDRDVRNAASALCRNVVSGDYMGEIGAVYRAFSPPNVRYVRDPDLIEWVQGPKELLATGTGDCFQQGTLVLAEGHRFVKVEDLLVGTKIWGFDKWTTVTDTAPKGIREIDVLFLNNGSSIRVTPEHKLYVALCRKHAIKWENGKSCSCPMADRVIERIGVDKAVPGMALLTPDRIDFGEQELDPERALIEGFYISDGWCEDYRFSISGKDGFPKENQKKRVKDICDRLGIATTWYEKSIRIHDSAWSKRMGEMGKYAPEKHALSISLKEDAARMLLEGIMADSGFAREGSGAIFTTTSRELMLQTRVLQKMFGVTCGEQYIVDHGGLGQNQIWRLTTRKMIHADGGRPKMLKIKAIARALHEAPVYDITTDDHYVYLPESDATVSNCDCISVGIASYLEALGHRCSFVLAAFGPPENGPSHVFTRVETKFGPVAVDPVANVQMEKMLREMTAHLVVPVPVGVENPVEGGILDMPFNGWEGWAG